MKTLKQLFFVLLGIAIIGFATTSCNQTGEEDENADSTAVDSSACPEKEVKKECKANTLTDEEKAEGWVLLFDGETSNGWHRYNEDAFPEQGWKIEDGKLTVIGSGQGEAGGKGGDIVTDKEYENFHLQLEWMVTDSANSGIFFLVLEKDDARIFHSAPEMQVLDDNGHPDANKTDQLDRLSHRAGSLYDLIPAPEGAFKGANVWNKAEIIKNGDKVTFKLNDVVTAEFTLWNDEWKEMVKNSKFNQWDLFGTGKKGNIGLQDHGDTVHFRNIKIKEL